MYKKKQKKLLNGGNCLHEIFIQTQAINKTNNNNLTFPKGKVFKIYS